MPEAEVALTIADGEATIRQAAWTDPIASLYGVRHDFVEVDPADLDEGSGAWVSPRLILNKPHGSPGPPHPADRARRRRGTCAGGPPTPRTAASTTAT